MLGHPMEGYFCFKVSEIVALHTLSYEDGYQTISKL